MDVCLVSPPTAAEFSPLEVSSEAAQRTVSQPQLGILSLAAVLAALGNAPSIVDLNAAYIAYVRSSGSSDREGFATLAAELLAAQNAGVYGFGTICSSYPLIIRIAAVLKSLLPESTVLLGGPQASVVDHPTLAAFPFVDYILRGEAEH